MISNNPSNSFDIINKINLQFLNNNKVYFKKKNRFCLNTMETTYKSYTLCLMHSLTASLGGILFGYFMSIYNPLQQYFHTQFS